MSIFKSKQVQVETLPTAGEIRAIYHLNKHKELERLDYKLKTALKYLKDKAQEGYAFVPWRSLDTETANSLRKLGFECQDIGNGETIIKIS